MDIVKLAARRGVLLPRVQICPKWEVFFDADKWKPSRKKLKINKVNYDQATTETESSREEYTVHNVGRYSDDSVYVHKLINGKTLRMELDTWEEVSINFERTREEIFPEEKIRPSDLNWRLIPMNRWRYTNRHTERKTPVRGSVQEVSISGYSW